MNKIELVKAEIERLKENSGIGLSEYDMGYENGVCEVCVKLLNFINSIPEEPISEDLEKEIGDYLPTIFSKTMDGGEPRFTTWFRALLKTAHHFANWQKEQFEQNRLAACDRQTKEEAEREVAFVESILLKENREPTYSDAIEYGMKLKEQQMLKDAISCEVQHPDVEGIELEDIVEILPNGLHLNPEKFKAGDKVKVIVIKE